MQKLTIPTGTVEIQINGRRGLRVNPGDPDVYMKCAELCRDLPGMSERLRTQADSLSDAESLETAMAAARELDAAVKARLNQIFNADFDALLGGVSMLAIAENGHTVLENLLTAVMPALEAGIAARGAALRGRASVAVAKANKRRKAAAPRT